MILVEEAMEQRLQEKREDAAHLPGVVFDDKWDAAHLPGMLDASFGWLNRWGGNGSLGG